MPDNPLPKIDDWMWLIEIAIGIGLVSILSLIIRKGVSLLHKRYAKKDAIWAKNLQKIVHLPFQIAIWGFALAYTVDICVTHFGLDALIRFVRPTKVAFVIACFGWIILRWNKHAFHQLAKKSEKLGVAAGTIYALGKLTSFVITILVMMIIFQIFGLDIAPLLAFGGIGMAGIAFAAQDMMSNFFGGAMLHFTRIFSIGDEVVIPSQSNFEGEVKEIGWYTTMIEDYYRRPVYFPNALFSKAHVINESRRSHRRIKMRLTLRYEDMPHMDKIVKELREKVGAHDSIDNTQSFSITFDNLGDSGLEIYCYLLVYKMGYVKFLQVKQDLCMTIQEVVTKYGAEFAYPTQEIHLAHSNPIKE